MPTCVKCKEDKPPEAFRKYRKRCKACNNAIEVQRKREKWKNDEYCQKQALWAKKYRRTLSGWASGKITQLKKKCKDKGLTFDISREWLMNKFAANKCEWSGIEFNLENMDLLPSVDRLDPTKGYTEDNCRVILHCLNAFKGQMPTEECEKIMAIVMEAKSACV